MQESVEPSQCRRNERSRNKIGEAECQTKNIEGDRGLVIKDEKKRQETHEKGQGKGDFVPDHVRSGPSNEYSS